MTFQRVLVTGATGFLGKHLMVALSSTVPGWCASPSIVGISRSGLEGWGEGPFPRRGNLRCDITDSESVRGLMAAYRPDIIFHLAATPLVRDTSPAMVRSNVLGAYNLIEYAPEGARFVLASSATVYGDSYREKYEWDRLAPTSPYGASKVAAEAFLSVYNQQGRLSGLALRFVAIVGPGATHGVVPDLVAKAQRPGPTLEVLGCPPGSSKPYLHISDALAAMLRFGFDRSIEGAINISPSDQMTSEDIANVVLRTAGQSRALSWSSTWPGDNPSVRVSTSRATALGWAPRLTSEEAIEAAVRGE